MKIRFPNTESIKKTFVRSTLVKADRNRLEELMNNDKGLSRLLLTPAGELPEKYSYLLSELFPGWEETSLYYLIDATFKKVPNDQIYFSMAGDKIVGWCAYTTEYNRNFKREIVNEIKMFSFDINRPNPVLLRDLESMINILLDKYGIIFWEAVKKNPANKIYERAINKYQGFKEEVGDNVYYTIQRN